VQQKGQGQGQGLTREGRRDGDSSLVCNGSSTGTTDARSQDGVAEARSDGTAHGGADASEIPRDGCSGGAPESAATLVTAGAGAQAAAAGREGPGGGSESLEATLGRLDAEIGKFFDSLAPNVAVLAVTGFGDTPAVRR